MAKTDSASGLYDTLRVERETSSAASSSEGKVRSKEKSFAPKGFTITRRISKPSWRPLKEMRKNNIFIGLREQAVRDREEEVPNPERVERFLSKLAQALSIIDKLPQHRREELLTKLRSVQLIPADSRTKRNYEGEVTKCGRMQTNRKRQRNGS